MYYFGMFTLMGVLGFLNGFVLLPIILSWIGPPTLVHMKDQAHFVELPPMANNAASCNDKENKV
jgi:hypothetical protein